MFYIGIYLYNWSVMELTIFFMNAFIKDKMFQYW